MASVEAFGVLLSVGGPERPCKPHAYPPAQLRLGPPNSMSSCRAIMLYDSMLRKGVYVEHNWPSSIFLPSVAKAARLGRKEHRNLSDRYMTAMNVDVYP